MNYLEKINILDARLEGFSGAGAKVLVIDTGYDFRNGIVDPVRSIGLNGSAQDTIVHGTMVTNVISSLAPNADFYIANASNNYGTFNQLDVAEAIRWGIFNDVDVINISVAGFGFVESELLNAVNDAIDQGIDIVAATGNSAPTALASWPAYLTGVHGVGSIGWDDDESSFSQGGHPLDIFAPGESITTTGLNNASVLASGTSLSTPMVTGAMALMIEAGKDPSDIYNYVLPVIGEIDGQLNIGFATHTTGEALLHHWQNVDDLTISYLIPPQSGVYDVKVYVIHNSITYDLDSTGGFVENSGADHLISFDDLPRNYELVGNLFGYHGVYDYVDASSIDSGTYEFSVELLDQEGLLVQIVGQELIEII